MVSQSNAEAPEGRKDLDGPDDILELHETSALLIQEDDLKPLYSRILDAAIGLMSSDMASMQLLDPQRDHLRLFAWKGFHPQSATFWESVHFNSASTCGFALATGSRVVVPDVDICDFMAGTADLDEYRRSDIRAVQSTPLVSRSGRLLGMISTHWREPHQPTERALRRLDVLARQAADLIERTRAEAALDESVAALCKSDAALRESDAALRESNDQLRWYVSIVENSNDAIIAKNLDGIIMSWNKGAEQVFGYTAKEAVGKPVTLLIPPELHHEEPTILERIRRGECTDHYETIRRRKDGSLINISLTVSPVRNAQGKIVGASKIARDITERKRHEERITMLAREAEHRTKNILATVQATVNLSHSDTADGVKRAIEGRIQALANVHALLVEASWKGADLSTLARRELAPYLQDNGARTHIDGPKLFLEPNTAQTIAAILHELATNAAKYGALSVAKGRVEVKWSVAANQLVLTWTESGGPMVEKPTRQGFGTRVMERMIKDQHKGDLRLDWRAEGLACEIILPMLGY